MEKGVKEPMFKDWRSLIALYGISIGLIEYLSYKLMGYGMIVPTLKGVGLWLLDILSAPL